MQEPSLDDVHVHTENFTCQNCGGTMKFDIKSQKFICSACRDEKTLETLSDTVKEYDFAHYHQLEAQTTPFTGRASVHCDNCGLEFSLDESQIASVCPMCSSTHLAQSKQESGIPPEGIIPFAIDQDEAQKRFHAWVKRRWFAPNKLKKSYGEGNLVGMYLPFWTYDASVISHYSGDGGTNRTVKDKDGKERTVTDWRHVSGIVSSTFDDVLVCASTKQEHVDGILPYNTSKNAKPYSPGYLSGYYAEVYKIKADSAFQTAKGIMDSRMEDIARSEILQRYDEARVNSIDSTFSDVTYKHLLLPLWSSAFGYNGKTYSYLINGETGKVSGDRPYSVPKIAAAVAAVLALVILFFILYYQ